MKALCPYSSCIGAICVCALYRSKQMMELPYDSKSPEKSSPSFPEDVEDDEEGPPIIRPPKYGPCSDLEDPDPHSTHDPQMDVTMLAEDEDDDTVRARSFALTVDSPRHPADSSEKKVHWSNQSVQMLLDCVEKHLDEFNIQKKHKQVWQTIGAEMESLGFTMEHCYNKWKNLRRDVRLLVNNPQKAVRNADILRRVARLILVIYPNIDATTMQVTGDRSGGKSAPTTPVGPSGLSCRLNMSSALHAPDSPRFTVSSIGTPHPLTTGFHSCTPNGIKYKNDPDFMDQVVPGTALFTELGSDNDAHDYSNHVSSSETKTNPQASGFPFFLNPAAAALLVQSQLFTDLLRQQQRSHEDEVPNVDSAQQNEQTLPAASTPKVTAPPHSLSSTSIVTNGVSSHQNVGVSLASTLLNGLASADHSSHVILPIVSSSLPDSSNQLDRLPPGSELAGVVERLRDEETVHMRLTDMVTHIADELRAAGMRRRAALDQLLGLMQGSRIPNPLIQKSNAPDTSSLV
ncbi:unnamed protein product [Calicophoron daubneyi]|uniref:Myb-like domain-containing protein n=1 Tax=Calicophoron daubneyi TaxID=300641 RepID=A0AAV2TUM0_CALDB